MTKQEFISELYGGLSQLPKEEIKKQEDYFSELIDDMCEDGSSEDEAVAKLGSAQALSVEILQDQPLATLVKSRMKRKKDMSIAAIVLLVLGFPLWLPIIAALVCVLLCVYLTIWVIVASFFAVSLAIALGGVAAIAGAVALAAMFIGNPVYVLTALMVFSCGVALIGIAILFFLLSLLIAKGAVKLTVLIAHGVKSLFIKKGKGKTNE